MTDDLLRLVADRQEIGNLLNLYSRGVDRCDRAALLAVWAEGATLDYGSGWEDARAWSIGLLERLRPMASTMHALSNMIIELDGDQATAETYCQAYHLLTDGETPRRMIVGGRYLDELQRQAGAWKIRRRRYVMDWNETEPSTALFGQGAFARFSRRGSRHPDDPLYQREA